MIKPLTAKQLHTAGRELYGERWQTELAHALDKNPRTIRRYASGSQRMEIETTLAIFYLIAFKRGYIPQPERR